MRVLSSCLFVWHCTINLFLASLSWSHLNQDDCYHFWVAYIKNSMVMILNIFKFRNPVTCASYFVVVTILVWFSFLFPYHMMTRMFICYRRVFVLDNFCQDFIMATWHSKVKCNSQCLMTWAKNDCTCEITCSVYICMENSTCENKFDIHPMHYIPKIVGWPLRELNGRKIQVGTQTFGVKFCLI